MKKIKITQGLFVQVDDWNYDWLNQWPWYAHRSGNNFYAKRSVWEGEDIYMHRLIMNTPPELEVDHIDHNGLNCLEENMRNCTHSQNMSNRSVTGEIPYIGVHYKRDKRYTYIAASIKIEGKNKHLGIYPTPELAALAYDVAAMKQGRSINLNFF